eukprot:CAMPEP_0194371098 /NCGR_PEP_ID=MMETSP0174-20130528/19466_1 /TAXON_ID=216777 /ORGANISM="Proboscia alata, Strain PI-D3" /LENGTH=56 /DNA_ID=CAMNT_0039148945 /DNA_START=121 /DNA_END=287 /DNA_ORIENTATION=+
MNANMFAQIQAKRTDDEGKVSKSAPPAGRGRGSLFNRKGGVGGGGPGDLMAQIQKR